MSLASFAIFGVYIFGSSVILLANSFIPLEFCVRQVYNN